MSVHIYAQNGARIGASPLVLDNCFKFYLGYQILISWHGLGPIGAWGISIAGPIDYLLHSVYLNSATEHCATKHNWPRLIPFCLKMIIVTGPVTLTDRYVYGIHLATVRDQLCKQR